MKKAAVCTIVLLVSSLYLSAQSTTFAQSAQTRSVRAGSACPIEMRARHAFLTQRELASDQKLPKGGDKMTVKSPGIQIRLTLDGHDKRAIASANLTVTGLKGDGGVLNLTAKRSNGNEQQAITRRIDVRFEAGDAGAVDSYFAAQGLSMVQTVKLNSVTYADGSTWKLQDANTCSVTPDPLMLIADR